MGEKMLEFQDINYTYPGGQKPALNGLNSSIPATKKNALLGQNGSGKSTLLFLADGLLKPQQGQIRWARERLNYDRHSLNQWRQKIGLAFQDPEQQLVAGTVAEDIAYGLYTLKLSQAEIKQRLGQTLAEFGLQDLANHPLHHLSLGQKRRVALAGVMARQPELLLLDEPTAYLDSVQTGNLLEELERIHAAGTTLVIATHDLSFAYQWADWIVILHEGQLIMSGEAQDIFSQGNRLAELHLAVPILWEVWQVLVSNLSLPNTMPFPKTIRHLEEQLRDWNKPSQP
ncbi:energy-coupling factor ABC transporter ATP-binding protein [Coleofasciculus sp. E1-EBD-02]|uniref:energy-coupling factor ABC transporter ATP-binding protein n=1 Tax=Coleofasciculus sp. E1-EBD-02 TaxID=3068481 RepID=UPI003303C688